MSLLTENETGDQKNGCSDSKNLLRKRTRTQIKREAVAKQLEDDLIKSDDEDSDIFGLKKLSKKEAKKDNGDCDTTGSQKIDKFFKKKQVKLEHFSIMSCDYDDARSVLSASTNCKFNPTGMFKENPDYNENN